MSDEQTDKIIADGTIMAVTFDDWFYAPDGQSYRVAFGPCTVVKAKALFGFEPKASANWFVRVGEGERAVLLAGCRVHAAMLVTTLPPGRDVYNAVGL